jgi:superfamily II DNA/RNA helicase
MNSFTSFGLSKTLEKSILNMGFISPTSVQEKSIPLALEGRDLLGSAQTGTGKTGAFAIPLIQKLMRDEMSTALVLTPTRELAKQVLSVIEGLLFGQNAINISCLIGGEQITKQLKQLRRRPRIVVGTPGRINDHLIRKSLKLDKAKFIVLDETDRMLDMGFGVQIDRILKYIPKERQTLMFSATLPEQIIKLSKKYLTNPERVSIGKTNVIAQNINNEIIKIKKEDKYNLLLEQLENREGTILIFVKTKHGTVKMAKNLSHDHFTSEPLNGNLRQNKRDTVMRKFREKKFRIMVATDIAARGLDVPHIEHVINYDLPQLAEDYIHRLGRTGRANSIGSAVTFVSSKELDKWEEIQIMLDPSIKKLNSKNRSSKSKEKKKQFKKNKIKSSLSRNKDRKKGNYSKSKKTNDENSSNFNKFTRKRTSDDTDDKKTFNKKKKRFNKRKFDKDSHTLISSFKKKNSLDKKSKSKFKTNGDSSKKNIRKSKNSKKIGFKYKALNRPKTLNRFKNKFSRAK